MEIHHLKMYFKAGVLVPFYLACTVSVFFGAVSYFSNVSASEISDQSELYHVMVGTLYSGIIGLCSFTIFFNRKTSIATDPLYRIIAWFLLPACFMVWVLFFEINWKVVNTKNQHDDFITIYKLCIIFFHSIGLLISFMDFRASMLIRQRTANSPNLKTR